MGLKGLTEDRISPLTVNQLLLSRNSDQACSFDESGELQDLPTLRAYSRDLLRAWWKVWKEQSFSRLLPFDSKAAATPRRNLEPGDVCQLMYKTKVTSYYRLCLVKDVTKSEDGLVRTVRIVLRNRRAGKDVVRQHLEPVEMEVGIQRLCLILPKSEQTAAEEKLLEEV